MLVLINPFKFKNRDNFYKYQFIGQMNASIENILTSFEEFDLYKVELRDANKRYISVYDRMQEDYSRTLELNAEISYKNVSSYTDDFIDFELSLNEYKDGSYDGNTYFQHDIDVNIIIGSKSFKRELSDCEYSRADCEDIIEKHKCRARIVKSSINKFLSYINRNVCMMNNIYFNISFYLIDKEIKKEFIEMFKKHNFDTESCSEEEDSMSFNRRIVNLDLK